MKPSFRTWLKTLTLALIATVSLHAHAALNVVACEPEWASLAKELGGDKLNVSAATTAMQDPHHIEARPSLIARVRNADLLVCTGMELEIGWLPVLIQQSGNAKLTPGSPANFEAGRFITPIEVPTRLDRADGDVHADGNPHIQLDPRNIARVATALSLRLQQLDAANAAAYAGHGEDFQQRWQQAQARWGAKAAPLKGMPVASQHKAFTYLYDWLALKEVAVLEPKPGVEPSVSHLQNVLASLKAQPARMVLYAAYQDGRPSEWLQKNAGIPAVKLPFTVGGTDAAKDLFGLFDDTLDRLLAAAGGAK
jgi:zinc/manganese transport system substrate-binding protein